MKLPPKTKLIDIDVFNCQVIVLANKTQLDWMSKKYPANDFFFKNNGGSYYWGDYNGEEFIILCWLDKELTTLTHECVHIAHCIMERNGIPINFENTETQAYLTSYLFKMISGE